MTAFIGRREFITLLGGAAAAWPLAARAQQPAMPVIGFLGCTSARGPTRSYSGIPAGSERNRLCRRPERGDRIPLGGGPIRSLPELAADLVRASRRHRCSRGHDCASRRKGRNHDDPDRLHLGDDPVKLGLVTSLNRPGGKRHRLSFSQPSCGRSGLELLRELVPRADSCGACSSIRTIQQGAVYEQMRAEAAARARA